MHRYLNDRKGFTLLEALMGMFVMSVLFLLILQMVMVLNDNMISYYNKRQDVLFVMQANRDILKAKNIKIDDNILVFETYEGDEVSYSQSGDEIVRKVNNEGYEVVLSNIDYVNFYMANDKIYAEVKHKNEEEKNIFIGKELF